MGPTQAPTAAPTQAPTAVPTQAPTAAPTAAPTLAPTAAPTQVPTAAPTLAPTAAPPIWPIVTVTTTPAFTFTTTPAYAPPFSGVWSASRLVAKSHQKVVGAEKKQGDNVQRSWGSGLAWLSAAGAAGTLALLLVRSYRRRVDDYSYQSYQGASLITEVVIDDEGLEAANILE